MPLKRWSEEQIIYAVKQSEAGKKAADICRELGSASKRSTRGSAGIVALESKSSGSSGSCATRTAS